MLAVRVRRDLDVLDLPLVDSRRRGEQLLDLFLRHVRELVASRVEELDAVVLRRVVRRGDDDSEIEREQRDRGSREDAAENAVAARGDHTARERLFELDARGSCVTPDEYLRRPGPQGSCATEPLDELGRDELAHDAAHPIGAEVLARHDEALSAC